MLYSDDAGIVSRLVDRFAKMMEAIVKMCECSAHQCRIGAVLNVRARFSVFRFLFEIFIAQLSHLEIGSSRNGRAVQPLQKQY